MEIEVEDSTIDTGDFAENGDLQVIATQIENMHMPTATPVCLEKSSSAREKTPLSKHQPEHDYTKSIQGRPKKYKMDQKTKKQLTCVQPDSHDYIKSQSKPCKFNALYEDIRSFMKQYRNNQNEINEYDREKLASACIQGSTAEICDAVMSVENLRKQIIGTFSAEIDKKASTMTKRKYSTSILMQKSLQHLKGFNWFLVVGEFKHVFPDLMVQLISLMLKRESQILYTELEKIIPRLGAIYGILMQGRNQELSLIQRMNSLLLFDNICDQKVSNAYLLTYLA